MGGLVATLRHHAVAPSVAGTSAWLRKATTAPAFVRPRAFDLPSAPMPPHDFYASPAIYDILHTPGTAGEVDSLLRLARRFLPAAKRRSPIAFLEPACGTGRYLRILASRGHRAIGFDREPAMVQYAATRLARFGRLAHVFQADMETFATRATYRGPARSVRHRQNAPNAPTAQSRGRWHVAPASIDLAFTPINSIRHLPTDRAMLAHLSEIASVLRPTGLYAVGISITTYGIEQPSEDTWTGTRGPCRVDQFVQYLPAPGGRGPNNRDETVLSHLTVTTPTATRHLDSTYTLRAYDLKQWERLIARSPLQITAVVDEDARDFRLAPPGYAIFILRPARGL